MAEGNRARLLGTYSQWFAIAICAGLGAILFTFVDLTPKVQAEFFFSTDDPQFQSSLQIEKEFGDSQQIFIAVRSRNLVSRQYLQRLYDLTEELLRVKGISEVRSLTHGPKKPEKILKDDPDDVFEDLVKSPFWSRLLLAPDHSATFVVVRLQKKNSQNNVATITAIDRILDRHSRSGFELGASGVSYVAEHIRRRLSDDLQRFSIAAFVAFAVLVTVLFRSFAILLGTMVASLTASFGTFLVRAMLGMPSDILMPNLWTIAFILTLSHIVYIAAEWRREARKVGAERAVRESVRLMGPASAWSLAANLLGFATLIFVSAKPLRQFGISGAIASGLAMVCAFGLFPAFLRAADPGSDRAGGTGRFFERFFTTPHRSVAIVAIAVGLVLAPFAWRVNTDPSLPSYFGGRDRIHTGLAAIDRAAGSSPLDIVVADAGGESLDKGEAFKRLETLQHRLERHPDVGAVLSIAPLVEEAERPWYSFLFSRGAKLKRLESPKHGRIGSTFIDEDRRHARFILRMREQARSRPREVVVGEIEGIARDEGFRPVLVGGLYPLQGELSKLVEGSVVRGLAGLIACFSVIVLIASRSLRTALAMTVCLAITPFAIFGLVGLLGMPLDIISAPAANVALPMGIDEMIHTGYTVRRLRQGGKSGWTAWHETLAVMWRPILASVLIVTSGFALFLLSSFPPTQRLGVLVCVGTAITDLIVLIVLPGIVMRGRQSRKGLQSAA